MISNIDEGDEQDTGMDIEGDGDLLKMSLQEVKIRKLEVNLVNLNNLIGTLQCKVDSPETWLPFGEHHKLQVIKLSNKIKHTKLNIMKHILVKPNLTL